MIGLTEFNFIQLTKHHLQTFPNQQGGNFITPHKILGKFYWRFENYLPSNYCLLFDDKLCDQIFSV
jgi:hypothetical protein